MKGCDREQTVMMCLTTRHIITVTTAATMLVIIMNIVTITTATIVIAIAWVSGPVSRRQTMG